MSSSRACSASWRLSRSSAPHHLTPLSHFSPLFSPSTFSSSSLRRCYSSVTTRRSIHQYPAVRAATHRSSSPLHPRASLSLPVNLTQIRTMASEGTKIKVKNPVVELDGDEVCQLERKQEAKAGQGGKEEKETCHRGTRLFFMFVVLHVFFGCNSWRTPGQNGDHDLPTPLSLTTAQPHGIGHRTDRDCFLQ